MVKYKIYIYTGEADNAGTDANVTLTLYGKNKITRPINNIFLDRNNALPGRKKPLPVRTKTLTIPNIDDPNDKDDFEAGDTNSIIVSSETDLGDITKITIEHDNTKKKAGWYLDGVKVINLNSGKEWNFPAYRWLATDKDDGQCKITINAGAEMVHYSYIGNYPKDRENGWGDKLNGVCHDENNWYFTQEKYIWKFPVTHDLKKSCKKEDAARGIYKYRYGHHLGDSDCYNGYLFIPVEDDGDPYIMVFSTSDIHTKITSQKMQKKDFITGTSTYFKQFGWVAINPNDKKLYTSDGELNKKNPILVYDIDFDAIKNKKTPFLKPYAALYVVDEEGRYLTRGWMQGGCFDNQNHLHICNGSPKHYPSDGTLLNYSNRKGGITVYDIPQLSQNEVTTIKVKARSNQSHDFRFQFNGYLEEPEGITYWDLDGKGAPGISGQLHAIMIDLNGIGDTDLYFKHFRRI